MEKKTENSTQNAPQLSSEYKPVSLNEINYTTLLEPVAGNHRSLPEVESSLQSEEKKRIAISQHIFRWRSAIAVAAILVIAVLHFAYQLSFQNGVTVSDEAENVPVVSKPVFNQPVREESAKIKPSEIEVKNTYKEPPRVKNPKIKPRQPEALPARPQIRSKEIVETRVQRLRRAEKILTGV